MYFFDEFGPRTYHLLLFFRLWYDIKDIDGSTPVLPVMSPTAGRGPGSNGTASPLPSVKKYAPPPPASRRTGLPTLLPASSVIHKDGAFRRPAPPPPRKLGFLRGTEGDKQDGTEDDDDDDDDDDDTDSYVDASSEPVLDSTTSKPVIFKQDKTREIKSGQQPQKGLEKKDDSKADRPSPKPFETETLLKPSQLKNQQPGTAGTLFTNDKSTPVLNKITEKTSEIGIIRPALPSASSLSSNSSSAPASPVSLATVAANKSKVLLPGLDPRGKGGSGRHPAIASMGLGLGSAGVETHSNSESSPESPSLPSVLQRTKEYNNKSVEPEPPASATAVTGGANTVLPCKIAPKIKNTMTAANKEDKAEESAAPPPSVSELKKSFGSPVDNTSSKPVGSGIATSPGVKLAAVGAATPATPFTHTPGGDRQVLPVIPMVKPLSFTGAAGTTPATKTAAKAVPAVSSVGTTKVGGGRHHGATAANKVKMAGLGSVQAASVFKPSAADQEQHRSVLSSTAAPTNTATSGPGELGGGAKKIVKSEGSVEDVKPASGSVKQAIASLKASTGTGGEDGADGPGNKTAAAAAAAGGGEEEEEEGDEKVDAFAFWKSK